ncbi:MAG: glucose-6-phosphate isomerase, partial [Burkholderiaceae bacterium]
MTAPAVSAAPPGSTAIPSGPILTDLPAWKALQSHYQAMRGTHLRELFDQDPLRGEHFAVEAAGVYLDYSKNRITSQTISLLMDLAEHRGLRQHIEAMFTGQEINKSERRPVLHVALRAPASENIFVEGQNVVPSVHAVLERMAQFSTMVRGGLWLGYTGKRIKNVINIGIGGSA